MTGLLRNGFAVVAAAVEIAAAGRTKKVVAHMLRRTRHPGIFVTRSIKIINGSVVYPPLQVGRASRAPMPVAGVVSN